MTNRDRCTIAALCTMAIAAALPNPYKLIACVLASACFGSNAIHAYKRMRECAARIAEIDARTAAIKSARADEARRKGLN